MEYRMVDEKEFVSYIKEFSNLYKICFNQIMTEDEIIWRYLKNPNKRILACFAFDDGKLVANYSVSPIKLSIKEKLFPAVLSLNTMTHPNYAGKGLFVKLASKVYSEAAKLGYIGVVGFPNYISNRTFLTKLGWQNIYEVPTFSLALNDEKNNNELSPNIVEDSCFLCNDDMKSHQMINVFKDNEYIKWRYLLHPNNDYISFVVINDEIVTGRIVLKKYKNILNIVDYSYNDINDFISLLNQTIYYAKKGKMNKLTLWCKFGTEEHIYLEKIGFKNDAPITYFGGSLWSESIDRNMFFDYRNWQIHFCDDNVY